MKKLLPGIAVATLAIAPLVLSGVAGASTSTKCASAPARLAHIQSAEARVTAHISAIQSNLATATGSARIARLSARLSTLEATSTKLTTKAATLSARCPM